MSDFAGSGLLVAAAAFAAVVLAVLSLALLWEGARRWSRQRAIAGELRRLADQTVGLGSSRGLLRDKEGAGPAWLEPLVLHMPHQHDLQHFLAQGNVTWSAGTFVLLTVGLAAASGLFLLALFGGWLLPLAGVAAGAIFPYMHVSLKRRKRYKAFEEHFPEAIDLLGRAIRAGHAFSTGLKVVAEEMPEPVAGEFKQVYEEQKFGLPLSDSLFALSDRISLLDVRIFVTAVLIQLESGGNLAEILDNLSHIIRERFRFRRQLRTHTAHGRMTGMVLAGAPIVAGLGMWAINPEYMRPLFVEPLGRLMLAAAVTLQLIGFLWIRRIMDVEV